MQVRYLHSCLISLLIVFFACKDNPTRNNDDTNGTSGDKVVFVSYESGTHDRRITRLDLKNNKITHLTSPSPEIWVNEPRWSPDGKKILYVESFGFEEGHIVMINEDGTNKKILTDIGIECSNIRWNFSGDRFLFHIYLYGTRIGDTLGNEMKIPWDPQNSVFEGDSVWYDRGSVQWHSSDEFLFLWGSYNGTPGHSFCPEDSLAEIFLLEIESGKVIQRITNNKIDECMFIPSPDGELFVFHRGDHGVNQKYYSLDASTNEIQQLTSGPNDFYLEWTNNPNYLIYMKDENDDRWENDYRMYLLNLSDPSNEIKISDWEGDNTDLFIENVNSQGG